MKKRGLTISLIVLSCLFTLSIHAQNQAKADSLKRLVDKDEFETEEQLEALYWLSNYSSSPEDVLEYGDRLLELAISEGNKEYILKANYCIGIGYRLLGDLSQALEYQFKAANEAINNEELLPFLTEVYSEISTCYTQNGDSENALLYGAKAINILRKTGSKQELALTLLNAGYDYYLIGNYDSAMAYYNESEPLMKEVGIAIGLAYIKGNRALVFWKKGNAERAKEDLNEAIESLKPLGDTYGMADYYNQLGNIFLEEGNYAKVVEYASLSYEIAIEEGLKEQARDASRILYMGYQGISDYKNALDFQTNYHAYKDSIQNLETTQRIADLRTEYEVGKKQAEVDLLLEQKRSSQIIMITGGIILLIVIVLALVIYSFLRTKNRLYRQLEERKNSLLLLNETKDKFFSIISHDLRGPANTLNGLIAVSKIYIDEGKADHVAGMVDRMEHSIGSMIKLLDNLLNWALQQRGQFPYLPENLNAKKILESAVDTFEDMATNKKIDLTLEIERDFKLFVDRNTISTIIRNLINNAIKFTEEGGKIRVHAEPNTSMETGVIKISDSGIGIPKEKLDTLFNLNEKNSTPGTSGEKGLGLGLQLVVEFVALNKGKIEVESEVDKGTTFIISFPLSNR